MQQNEQKEVEDVHENLAESKLKVRLILWAWVAVSCFCGPHRTITPMDMNELAEPHLLLDVPCHR